MGALFWELTLRMERGAALERRVFLALEVIAARPDKTLSCCRGPQPSAAAVSLPF